MWVYPLSLYPVYRRRRCRRLLRCIRLFQQPENTRRFPSSCPLLPPSFSAFLRLCFAPGLSRFTSRQPALTLADLLFPLFGRSSLGFSLANRGSRIPFVARASFRALRPPSPSWFSLQTMASDTSDDDRPLARPNGRRKFSSVLTCLAIFSLWFFQFPGPSYILSTRDCASAYCRLIVRSLSNRAQVSNWHFG